MVCQRCDGFGGYPCEKQADACIDGKIDSDIGKIAQTDTVQEIVQEYIQGLQNQHLPHNQAKAFPAQKLHEFVAQQAMIAEAAMNADDNKTRANRIKGNNIEKAWQQHRREQAQKTSRQDKQCAIHFTHGVLLIGNNPREDTDNKGQIVLIRKIEQQDHESEKEGFVI